MKASRKWFTCTPVSFRGDETFFARDSGLMARGLREIGFECRAIMPGPALDGDLEDELIRTDFENLEDPEWWRQLDGDAVVLWAWGDGRYLGVARAIREAGMILITHLDTGGLFSLANGPVLYLASLWRSIMGRRGVGTSSLTYYACRVVNACTIRMIRVELPRARHLRAAQFISAITPVSVDRIRRVCRVYGGGDVSRRVHHVPHPCASYMVRDALVPKERVIVAVGRWDDRMVKGTRLLLEVAERVLKEDSSVRMEVYGTITPEIEELRNGLPEDIRIRFLTPGRVPNRTLCTVFNRARISLCTSLAESYHIASAEALCCGCSVVGPDVPELPSMRWFTSDGGGRIARRNSRDLSDAVLMELAAWDSGERNADRLSERWTRRLHAPRVAERLIELVSQAESDRQINPLLSF